MRVSNRKSRRVFIRLPVAGVLLSLLACGGTESTGPSESLPSEPEVAEVELLPPGAAAVPGSTVPFQATARAKSGLHIAGAVIEWSSSDESVATVDAEGRVTAISLGIAEIIARSGGESTTAPVVVIEEEFVSVTASGVHSCGLMGDGRAYCWGGNSSGMLGHGVTYERSLTPVPVTGDHIFSVVYSGTGATTCGVDEAGVARCWGHNSNEELGNGATQVETCPDGALCSTVPVAIDTEERFAWAGSLYKHSCALQHDGTSYCWGFNPGGQTGTDTEGSFFQHYPELVETDLRFESVDGGFNHSCGLATDGTIHCWGSAAFGVKGPEGEGGRSLAPMGDGHEFAAVASGGWHACGLTTAGEVYCWGRNSHGQLGAEGSDTCEAQGETENCSEDPVRVTGEHSFASITAGFYHSCALDTTGQAYCWGANEFSEASGILGGGSDMGESMTPVAVAGAHAFVSLDAGRFHTCATTVEGSAYCWGWGASGQLGDGRAENSGVPVRVFGSR